jgi:hypothetical protein
MGCGVTRFGLKPSIIAYREPPASSMAVTWVWRPHSVGAAHLVGYGPLVIPDVDAWEAWHPRVLTDRLAGLQLPWYVAAGWALDLFHGTQTRPHADLEIAVPAAHFSQIADRFSDCHFCVPHNGELVPATADALRTGHQTWAWDPATGMWVFDVFREPHDDDVWICRRDDRIRRPYTEIVERTSDGIPFLAPEIVLLFKAKNTRDKDEADFRSVLPKLDRRRRHWLNDALGLCHPAHPWRAILDASDALEPPS